MKVQTANWVPSKKVKWCHSEFISESLTQVKLRNSDPEGSGQNEKNAKNYFLERTQLMSCIGVLDLKLVIWIEITVLAPWDFSTHRPERWGRLAQNDTNLVISTEMRLFEPNGMEKSLRQIKVYLLCQLDF